MSGFYTTVGFYIYLLIALSFILLLGSLPLSPGAKGDDGDGRDLVLEPDQAAEYLGEVTEKR